MAIGLNIPLGSLFGLPRATRQANHVDSYLPVHCMRFAWFECGEEALTGSNNLPCH